MLHKYAQPMSRECVYAYMAKVSERRRKGVEWLSCATPPQPSEAFSVRGGSIFFWSKNDDDDLFDGCKNGI